MADDHVPEARHLGARFVDHGLGGDESATPVRGIDGDHGLRPGIVEARHYCLHAEAGEQRQHNRADFRHGEQ